jgi:hypothetical protein
MSDHLSPETVSDLAEGLLAPNDASAAEAHLAGCAECSDVRSALADVRALLATVPDAGPMPASVADRIDAALTAEAAASPAGDEVDQGAPTVGAAAATVTPLAGRRAGRTSRSMRWLQAAAVFVVLAAGGAIVVSALQSGNKDQESSTTAAADAGAESRAAAGSAGPKITSSGQNYSADSLATAARALVAAPMVARQDSGSLTAKSPEAAPQVAPGSPSPTQSSPDGFVALSATGSAAKLQACTDSLAGGPIQPLAVDFARYDGNPAVIVVLPGAKSGQLWVYVVGPDCSPADEHVLQFQAVTQ